MKDKKKIKLLQNQSITLTMFILSLATITIVLLIGSLIIGVVAPRIYCNSVFREIKNNLITTIQYYEIDLDEINLDSIQRQEASDSIQFGEFDIIYIPNNASIDDLLSRIEDDKIRQSLNLQYILGSIAMSRGATVSITNMEDEVIYQTPVWFSDNIKSVRFHDKPSTYFNRSFILGDFVENETWVTRSQVISLDQDYVLNVRLDLRTFNQNIRILNTMFYYMLAVGGLFAIIFSVILSFIVTKPLKELKKIAISMENMDFNVRYDKSRNDEIGQLGNTLNHMMDRLGTTINKLQAELQKEKRTDKLRREFVAQVSHELKTPVAIVSNYTEALLDGVADTKEEQDSYLSIIESECHKMAHIINDLLDLSQMEAGTFKIDKSEFEFKYLLEDLVGKYNNTVMGKYNLITDIKIDSAIMYGDELRLEQSISNLLSNAFKHTKDGGYIKLSAKKENNILHIQVENEGDPIDKTLLLHIWDSFTKGEHEKGAGLGLSITKNIVELHNGEYYVQNLENSVVFGIRLPLK